MSNKSTIPQSNEHTSVASFQTNWMPIAALAKNPDIWKFKPIDRSGFFSSTNSIYPLNYHPHSPSNRGSKHGIPERRSSQVDSFAFGKRCCCCDACISSRICCWVIGWTNENALLTYLVRHVGGASSRASVSFKHR